jgi:nucleotide-binding universal stress UspA family protein
MLTYSAVLIPLDGSGFAEDALPAGVSLARRSNAAIHLVRVHSQLPLWDVGAEVVVLSPEMEKEIMEREKAYLEEVKGSLRGGRLTVSTAALKGEVAPALKEYCGEHEIDLIVMTTHGRGGIRRAMLGSVADELVRTSSVPVLIVTTRSAPNMTTAWPSRIMVPLDGSIHSTSALEQVRALDPERKSKLLLTAVVQTIPPAINPWVFPPELSVDTVVERDQQLRGFLNRTVRELRTEGFRVASRIAVGSKVAREILKQATGQRCDLIVMTTHGAGGLDRVMFGSVADQVLRHSNVPVLVVRPVPEKSLPFTTSEPARGLAKAGV